MATQLIPRGPKIEIDTPSVFANGYFRDQALDTAIKSPVINFRCSDEAVALPTERVLFGTTSAEISRDMGLANADVEALEQILDEIRDRRPAKPLKFE